MKMKLATLLIVSACLWSTISLAQPQPTPAPAPQPASPTPAPAQAPHSQPTGASPATVAPAPVELGATATNQAKEVEPLIQFEDADLIAAIKTLARQANLNIIFDETLTAPGPNGKVPVQPKISDRFVNVTALDALDAILDNYHLEMTPDPRTTRAKIYRVIPKAPNALPPLFTRVIPLKYTSPTNIIPILQSTFADPKRSKVIPDIRTSQIVVLATETELAAITNLIAKIDKPTKQVLIEARLLETSQNPHSIRGIDWTRTLEAQNITLGNGFTSGQTTTTTPGTPATTTLPSGRTITTTPASSTLSTLNTLVGNGGLSVNTVQGIHPEVAFLSADGARVVLSALNEESDTEVIATPRAVTLDNEPAVLSVTKAFPIFQQSPGSPNTPATSQVIYTNLGTILTVTPRISGETNVALKIVPEVSNIDSKDTQIINGQQNEANVFAFRKLEANVLIPSGNTLVMGGLISDSTTKAYAKVPILGDLPLIGLVFRHEDRQRNKQNLIIFITPTVIQDTDFQPTRTQFLKQKPPSDEPKPDRWLDRGTRQKLDKNKPLFEQ